MVKNIVLLHGWGENAATKLTKLANELELSGFKTTVLTFPGFGEPEPVDNWGVEEYSRWVVTIINKKKISSPILFGHSFGGQIAAFIAANNLTPITGLVLVASGAIRKPPPAHKRLIKSLSNHHLTRSFKPVLKKLYQGLYPQSDYHNSSPIMQKVLAKVVTQDLSGSLNQINVPTLIIWGDNDQTLPVSLARETHDLIPNSTLKIFPSASHSVPYSHSQEISEIIKTKFT